VLLRLSSAAPQSCLASVIFAPRSHCICSNSFHISTRKAYTCLTSLHRRVLSLLPHLCARGPRATVWSVEGGEKTKTARSSTGFSKEELSGPMKRSSMRMKEQRMVSEKRRRGRWPTCVLPVDGEAPSAPR
jgi:hypothetical protein